MRCEVLLTFVCIVFHNAAELMKLQLLKQTGKIRIMIIVQILLMFHRMNLQNQVQNSYVTYVMSVVYSFHACV